MHFKSAPFRARWLFLLAVIALSPFAHAQGISGVPFIVQNAASVDQVNEPVASGVPVPEFFNITNPNAQMRLTDDTGASIPVQFKVLSRWNGQRSDATKKVKWMLVEFLATVPASSERIYGIDYGTKAAGSLTATQTASEMRIDTGAGEFVFDRVDFSLMKEVWVDGQLVTGREGQLQVRDTNYNFVDALQTELVFEELGSVRTVVRQKGVLGEIGLDFTVRYYFYAGRSDVKVDFRLENNGGYGLIGGMGSTESTAHFADLALSYKLNAGNNMLLTNASTRGVAQNYWLTQGFGTPSSNTDMLSGFAFGEYSNGNLVGGGNRFDGSVALLSSAGSLTVSVDRFWQNFPKGFDARYSTVRTNLWPVSGSGPHYYGRYGNPTQANQDAMAQSFYRLEGGRWKTHTLKLNFRAPTDVPTNADVVAEAARLEKPLMGHLPIDLMFKTGAFSQPLVERKNWNRTSNNRYEQMVQVLADDNAATEHPSLGRIGLPEFRNRGGTYGGKQFFGWTNYGDIVWGDGYCSNHYDMPWGVLINYWRTGDYAFYDMGRDLIAHRRDYDQFHSTDPSANKRGGQFYEKGWTHGNTSASTPSHTWVNGLLTWYLMTGDEGSREAAIEVGDFIARQNPQNWSGLYGSRILGWQAEALLHLWYYLGESSYLSLAEQALSQFRLLELSYNAQGFVPNQAWSTPHAQSWMHAIVLSALGKYYYVTQEPSVLPLMGRMADYMENHVIGNVPSGSGSTLTKALIWERSDGNTSWDASVHHSWAIIDGCSYAAIFLHRPVLMNKTQLIWESVTRYHQESPGTGAADYNDPNTWSDITFKMAQFPGSESKVMSNMALWGQSFMAIDDVWRFYVN